MSLLEVNHATRLYPNGAGICDVSFTIDRPGVFGILGRNGAGKSTLLNVITGYSAMCDNSRGTKRVAPNGSGRLVPRQG